MNDDSTLKMNLQYFAEADDAGAGETPDTVTEQAEDVVTTDESTEVTTPVDAVDATEETLEATDEQDVVNEDPEQGESKDDDKSNEEIVQLTAKVDELTNALATKDSEIVELKAYEQAITDLLDVKKASIPDELVDLLPEGNALQQLAWLSKAEGKGLFKKKENPEVEIGTFIETPTDEQRQTDNLSARDLLSAGVKQLFK